MINKLEHIKDVLQTPNGENLIDLVDDAINHFRVNFEKKPEADSETAQSPGPYGTLHLEYGNFGQAIMALKNGLKVSRKGWNGKGMYLWLLPAATIQKDWVKDPLLLSVFGEKDTLDCLGSIRMLTATGEVLTGWLASQTDMLANDWGIVE